MHIYEHPLLLLRTLQEVYKDVRIIVDQNSDYIKIINDTPFDFRIQGIDPKLIFSILSASLSSENKVAFMINFYPKNEGKAIIETSYVYVDDVFSYFHMWIGLVKQYSRINLTADEQRLKQYEDEFYQELEILEDEANVKAFKLPQQIFINRYLEYVEEVLVKEEASTKIDYTELKEEVEDLKRDLPNLSMNKTMKGVSQILAKVRKSGINVIIKVWDEALKEIIKEGVKYGLNNHETIIQRLKHFFIEN